MLFCVLLSNQSTAAYGDVPRFLRSSSPVVVRFIHVVSALEGGTAGSKVTSIFTLLKQISQTIPTVARLARFMHDRVKSQ